MVWVRSLGVICCGALHPTIREHCNTHPKAGYVFTSRYDMRQSLSSCPAIDIDGCPGLVGTEGSTKLPTRPGCAGQDFNSKLGTLLNPLFLPRPSRPRHENVERLHCRRRRTSCLCCRPERNPGTARQPDVVSAADKRPSRSLVHVEILTTGRYDSSGSWHQRTGDCGLEYYSNGTGATVSYTFNGAWAALSTGIGRL